MTSVVICIPFRDRGTDPCRSANLQRILEHWESFGHPVHVFDDGRDGDEQFCRSAAYNKAARETDADVLVYTESDMLISHMQVVAGILLAANGIGLVVPFTQYRYLSRDDSVRVRQNMVNPEDCEPEFGFDRPNPLDFNAIGGFVKDNGRSIGPVNIVSRDTIAAIGQWDEGFEGAWFDDTSMKVAFDTCCGATRFIDGPAFHLYHLPGWAGDHLTDDDREATERNKIRYSRYLSATTPEQIRELTSGN